MTEFQIEVTCSPAMLARAVAVFEDEGLQVRWQEPMEERDVSVAQAVVDLIVVSGGTAAFNAAWAKFGKYQWAKLRLLRRNGEPVDDNPLDGHECG